MLNESDAVEIKILKILDSEEKWWTIEEISKSISMSKATIQKYTKKLKDRIKNLDIDDVFLKTSTSKGIYFHRFPSFNVQVIFTMIYKELLSYSILDAFLYNRKISSHQVSDAHYISVPSVLRKYKELNLYLCEFDIKIKLGSLVGEERQIRGIYSELYWELFKGGEWPFKLISKEFIYGVINDVERFFNLKIVSGKKERLAYWFAINALRRIMGYRVTQDLEINKFTSNNILFNKFVEKIRMLFPAQAAKNDPRDIIELEYFFFHIFSSDLIEKNKKVNDIFYQSHIIGDTLMYQVSKYWMELFEEEFGKTPLKYKWNQIFTNILQIHSLSYLYIFNSNLVIYKDTTSEFINYHPVLKKKMEYIYDEINKKYYYVYKNKEYLVKNYILLAQVHNLLHKFEKIVHVSLELSNGSLYEEFIEKKIKSLFSDKYLLNFVSLSDKTDILVTDFYHNMKNESYTLVSVDDNLSSRDYSNIEKSIHNILKLT